MQRIRVKSSNINSIGYDVNTKVLEVEFKSGSAYQYFDVPAKEYEGLMNASSKGKYLNSNIKGRYACIQVH